MKNILNILKNQKAKIILLLLITIGGFALRLAACFYDVPYVTHPDEPTIVNTAIDMLQRQSYFAEVYYRPDHFEIKCCAVVFHVFSYLVHGVSAPEAFTAHSMDFFVLARSYTAFWGMLMIPLTYLILEKLRKHSGLIGAALVAFYPVFIEHSAYATPDIVLAFFVLLIAYVSILYIEKPSLKYLALLCVFTGVGISIKYTNAICCLWIAILVCFTYIPQKEYKQIFRNAVFSAGIVFVTTFVIAPDLFINIFSTAGAILSEARSQHLGSDGLGFGGNLLYYLQSIFSCVKYEFAPFILLGMVWVVYQIVKKKQYQYLSLGLGILFLICTSVLSLHWERWGIPFYTFFLIFGALGFFASLKIAGMLKQRYLKVAAIAVLCCLMGIVGINLVISGAWTTRYVLQTDGRIDALNFCNANGITEENSHFEAYGPFNMRTAGTFDISHMSFDENGKLVLPDYTENTERTYYAYPEHKENVEYIILSSRMYDRYYAEPEKYADLIEKYEAIAEQYTLVYESESYVPHNSPFAAANIFNKIHDFENLGNTPNEVVIRIYKI